MNKLNLLMVLILTSCGNMSGGSTSTNRRNSDPTPNREEENRNSENETNTLNPISDIPVPPVPPAPPMPLASKKDGKKRLLPNIFGKQTKISTNLTGTPIDEFKSALERSARPGSVILKVQNTLKNQEALEEQKAELEQKLEDEKEHGVGFLKKAKRAVLGNSVMKKLEKTEAELQNNAATTIQNAWKDYKVKSHLAKARKSLISSQNTNRLLDQMLKAKQQNGPIYDNVQGETQLSSVAETSGEESNYF